MCWCMCGARHHNMHKKNHSSVDGGLVNHNVNITVILSL